MPGKVNDAISASAFPDFYSLKNVHENYAVLNHYGQTVQHSHRREKLDNPIQLNLPHHFVNEAFVANSQNLLSANCKGIRTGYIINFFEQTEGSLPPSTFTFDQHEFNGDI